MTTAVKPYPEYRHSDVLWLGEVPAHWELKRLKETVLHCRNGVWGDDPDGINDIACVRVADFDRFSLRVRMRKPTMRSVPEQQRQGRLLQFGDLLLEKSGGGDLQPVGAVVAYDHDIPAVNSNFIAKMQVAEGYDPFYLTYLHTHLYAIRLNTRSVKQTTGIQNLDSDQYLSEVVALPPLPEQTAIAAYLGSQDQIVNRFIRAKRRMIDLLNEQKQAIIQRAVTRGIDPHVPLKPSGVEWLDEIPQHWEMVPTRSLLKLQKQLVGSASTDYTLLSLTKRGIIPRDMENPEGKFPSSFDTYQAVEPGDLIFCLFDIDETPRAVGLSSLSGMITGAYTRFQCTDPATVDYVYLYYLTMDNGKSLKPLYTGLRKVITKSAFLSARMPLPPPNEQRAIVEHVRTATDRIDQTIQRTEQELSLIREYRTRLIADVVTGKLDVRGVELPALDDDDTLAEWEDDPNESDSTDDTEDENS